MRGSREGLTLTGALLAAVTASACCIGPVVVALLGIGGAAAAVALEPYRPWFIAVTVALLAAAFHLVYRRPRAEQCGPGAACEAGPRRAGLKTLLWIVTALILGALAFPYYIAYLL